jgi:hypothetical protein
MRLLRLFGTFCLVSAIAGAVLIGILGPRSPETPALAVLTALLLVIRTGFYAFEEDTSRSKEKK